MENDAVSNCQQREENSKQGTNILSQGENNNEAKSDEEIGGMKYFRAIHSFQGENDNELCVAEGDELTLDPEDAETTDEKSEWLWLIKENGEEGYVPGTHVELVIH